jgi:hypothetical protein
MEVSDELREVAQALQNRDSGLFLSKVKTCNKQILEQDGVLEIIPEERFFTSVESAVKAASHAIGIIE